MKECPICHKWFKSLGYARHRAMHTDNARKKDKHIEMFNKICNKENNNGKVIKHEL